MAFINNATRELVCKIVYYGPALGGKTTNLRTIYAALPPDLKGDLISLPTQQDRTLFFDFLPLDLGEIKGFKTKIALYTVPGQVYYNATRQLVLRGVDGIVFVADSQSERLEHNIDSLENMSENLAIYGYDIEEIPWVIQYNKRDLPDISAIEILEQKLNFLQAPFFESVAITGQGVKETLKKVSSMVLKRIQAMYEESGTERFTPIRKQAPPAVQMSVSTSLEGGELSQGSVDDDESRTHVAGDGESSELEPSVEQSSLHSTRLPRLRIHQVSNLFWKKKMIGKGKISIDSVKQQEDGPDYSLHIGFKIMGLFPCTYRNTIGFERKISVNVNGNLQHFLLFKAKNGENNSYTYPETLLWVMEGNLSTPIYSRFKTKLGTFFLIPERDTLFFKYLV